MLCAYFAGTTSTVADEQYERCRCIGRGGFSKVLAVKQMGVSENRYFALKVMSKRDMIDKKHTTDVFRERWMLIKAQVRRGVEPRRPILRAFT